MWKGQAITNCGPSKVTGTQTAIDLIDPGTMTLSGSHRNYVHQNLKPGTLYSYEVRALFGATAMTGWSNVAQQITKPLAPDLSTTNVTANSITLTWSATSFNTARLGDPGQLSHTTPHNGRRLGERDRTGRWWDERS